MSRIVKVKDQTRRLLEELPDEATWDDLIHQSRMLIESEEGSIHDSWSAEEIALLEARIRHHRLDSESAARYQKAMSISEDQLDIL